MAADLKKRRFDIYLTGQPEPELDRMEFFYGEGAVPVPFESRDFKLSSGPTAFCLCFVNYALHGTKSGESCDFVFQGLPGPNPARTIARLIDKEKWPLEVFGKHGGKDVIEEVFRSKDGDNVAGREGRPVKLRICRDFLPADSVRIFWRSKVVSSHSDLSRLAVLLEKQWKPHHRAPGRKPASIKKPSAQDPPKSSEPPSPACDESFPGPVRLESSRPAPALLYPFSPIEEVGRLFRTSVVSPSKEEFIKENVHRCALFPRVLEHLERTAEAVIVGNGASGKTTLALQVAFDRIKAKLPVYYLDVNEVSSNQNQQAVAAMSIAARHHCLLILDNAHLNGALASAICHERKRAPRNSQLLMVCREAKGDGNLAEWMNDPLRLTVEEKDLVGTLETVACRFLPPWDWVQAIHPDHIREWSKAFGGNLVAFTIAATERIEALRKGEMELGPEDARGWVDSHYLDPIEAPLSENERRGILHLAVLGQFEIRVPKHFLGDRLRQSQRSGAVHEILDFQRENSEFVLTHAALGKLLLTASAKNEVDQLSVLRQFMEKCPDRAENMVHAVLLGSEGEPPTDPAREHAHYGVTRVDARQLFREWIASPNWKGLEATSLEEPQPSLQEYFSRMFSAGFEGEEPLIDHAFLAHADRVIELALNVQFELLLEFLVKAEKILPQTHAMLLKEFKSPQRRSEVISRFLQSQDVNSDDFERPPRTKTEKFQIWLLDEAVSSKNSQEVLGLVWRSNLRAAGGWLKRLRKASGAAKFKRLLNHPTSVKLATVAFFDYQAAGGREVDQHGTKALTESLRLIQEEMPPEVMDFFKTVFSDVAIQKRLAERLSIVPKDEPGLKTLWKELTVFIPAKQRNEIKAAVGTVDGEQLLEGYRQRQKEATEKRKRERAASAS